MEIRNHNPTNAISVPKGTAEDDCFAIKIKLRIIKIPTIKAH
jgi:hypothetical protein